MIVGFIMDKVRSMYIKRGQEDAAKFKSVAVALAITCLMGASAGYLASFAIQSLQYLTFVCQLTFRASLYGINAAVLLTLYPSELFGKLFGLVATFTIIGSEVPPHVLTYLENIEVHNLQVASEESKILINQDRVTLNFEWPYRIYATGLVILLVYPMYLFFGWRHLLK